MKVKCVRAEIRTSEKDGSDYIAAVVLHPDGQTASRVYLRDDVCDLNDVEVGHVYDMYLDKNGYVLYFEKVRPAKDN